MQQQSLKVVNNQVLKIKNNINRITCKATQDVQLNRLYNFM